RHPESDGSAAAGRHSRMGERLRLRGDHAGGLLEGGGARHGPERRQKAFRGARVMKITLLPSEKGDCLLIQSDAVAILAEGGMPGSYVSEGRPFLGRWAAAGGVL